MFSHFLVNKKGMYHSLRFMNVLSIILAPFMIVHEVGEGGGSAEDQATFLKSVEEKAANAVKEKLKNFKDTLPEYASSEDINKAVEGLENKISELGLTEFKESFDKLKEAAEKQGTELTKLINQRKELESNTNVNDVIKTNLLSNKEDIKKFKDNNNKSHGMVMTMKAATNVVRSDISGDTMAMRIPGVGILQRRQPFIRNLFAAGGVSPNNHGVIRYVDQSSRTSGAKAVAEAAAYGQSDIDWIERNIPIEKLGHYIKVSREMMDDVDFVSTQINNELITGLNLKIDTDLLSGTGVTPNLKGLATSATAFTAGNYATTVQDANRYDLITVLVAQIIQGANYIPDYVIINEEDAVFMKLKKDSQNNYVMPPFVVMTPNGQMIVDGVQVVVNSGVTTNTMYLGDFTRGTIYSSDMLQIEMGYENDDFTKGLVTVRADERLALLIRQVDNGAFRKVTDIRQALIDIEQAV